MKAKAKPRKTDPDPTLLTAEQTAIYIGTTTGMLALSRHTGERYKSIPGPKFTKLGPKSVRYLKKDLDDWIAEQSRYQNNAEVHLTNSLK